MQNELLTQNLAAVGEEIGAELGAKMVKDFQDANPNELLGHFIGRNVIDQILAQPGCVGVRFYNALNESGEKTLVYVGVNSENEIISGYNFVDQSGNLINKASIVADRAQPLPRDNSATTWSWFD